MFLKRNKVQVYFLFFFYLRKFCHVLLTLFFNDLYHNKTYDDNIYLTSTPWYTLY